MTEKDKEIQDLRREIEKLKKINKSLQDLHFADLGEIAYQRKIIDNLLEAAEVKKNG